MNRNSLALLWGRRETAGQQPGLSPRRAGRKRLFILPHPRPPAFRLVTLCLFGWLAVGCQREAELFQKCGGDKDWGLSVSKTRDSSPVSAVIEAELQLKPGLVVWDLGAGAGYWTRKIATAVGPTGRVVATDTNSSCVDYLTAAKNHWDECDISAHHVAWNETVPAEEQVDRILMSNSIVFKSSDALVPDKLAFAYPSPVVTLRSLYEHLKVGGRVVYFRDFDEADCMDSQTLLSIFKSVGFVLVAEADPKTLGAPNAQGQPPEQRCRVFAVFEKAGKDSKMAPGKSRLASGRVTRNSALNPPSHLR